MHDTTHNNLLSSTQPREGVFELHLQPTSGRGGADKKQWVLHKFVFASHCFAEKKWGEVSAQNF